VSTTGPHGKVVLSLSRLGCRPTPYTSLGLNLSISSLFIIQSASGRKCIDFSKCGVRGALNKVRKSARGDDQRRSRAAVAAWLKARSQQHERAGHQRSHLIHPYSGHVFPDRYYRCSFVLRLNDEDRLSGLRILIGFLMDRSGQREDASRSGTEHGGMCKMDGH
jgi:hypothetical protein